MAGIVLMIVWEGAAFAIGGIYNSINRMRAADAGLFNTLWEGASGFMWGGFTGLLVGTIGLLGLALLAKAKDMFVNYFMKD